MGEGERLRVGAFAKSERVPLQRGDVGIEPRDGASAKKCACALGRVKDRVADLLLGDGAAYLPGAREFVVEPGVERDVVVLEIQRLEPRVRPVELLGFAEGIEEEALGGPVATVARAHRIMREIREHAFPFGEHPCGVVVAVAMRARGVEPFALHVERARGASVGKYEHPLPTLVAADLARGGNRIGERDARGMILFDEFEHERGGADLHRGGPLGHVRVAHDDVEATVKTAVGVRFVAGVHDGAAVHRVYAREHLEEIAALCELERAGSSALILTLDA